MGFGTWLTRPCTEDEVIVGMIAVAGACAVSCGALIFMGVHKRDPHRRPTYRCMPCIEEAQPSTWLRELYQTYIDDDPDEYTRLKVV